MKSFSKIVAFACHAAVAAVAVYLTAHYSAYVYKFHALSMFECSRDWFASHFDRPAALLTWCGRLFTQSCCRPALAIVLLMLLLAATAWMIRRHIICDSRFGAVSILPATLMLLFVMRRCLRHALLFPFRERLQRQRQERDPEQGAVAQIDGGI